MGTTQKRQGLSCRNDRLQLTCGFAGGAKPSLGAGAAAMVKKHMSGLPPPLLLLGIAPGAHAMAGAMAPPASRLADVSNRCAWPKNPSAV